MEFSLESRSNTTRSNTTHSNTTHSNTTNTTHSHTKQVLVSMFNFKFVLLVFQLWTVHRWNLHMLRSLDSTFESNRIRTWWEPTGMSPCLVFRSIINCSQHHIRYFSDPTTDRTTTARPRIWVKQTRRPRFWMWRSNTIIVMLDYNSLRVWWYVWCYSLACSFNYITQT